MRCPKKRMYLSKMRYMNQAAKNQLHPTAMIFFRYLKRDYLSRGLELQFEGKCRILGPRKGGILYSFFHSFLLIDIRVVSL